MVSVCENHNILANTFTNSYIITYGFENQGKWIVPLHKTKLEHLCYAFCDFKGRALLGVGGYLRFYDLGKK